MKKLVRETLNEISRSKNVFNAVGIGNRTRIENWCKSASDTHTIGTYEINDDYEVNIDWAWFKEGISFLPDYIRFNRANSFTVRNPDVPADELERYIPREVVDKLDISSYPPKYKLSDVMKVCKLYNNTSVILNSETDKNEHAAYLIRKSPRRDKRPGNVLHPQDPSRKGIQYSWGYKAYEVLKYIIKAGKKGRSYKDIITYAYQMSNPGKPLPSMGYWSGAFREGREGWFSSGPLYNYTEKRENDEGKMRYFVSDQGYNFIEENKSIFER